MNVCAACGRPMQPVDEWGADLVCFDCRMQEILTPDTAGAAAVRCWPGRDKGRRPVRVAR